jgi:hypothetical protein
MASFAPHIVSRQVADETASLRRSGLTDEDIAIGARYVALIRFRRI